jgi:hypothetical protein
MLPGARSRRNGTEQAHPLQLDISHYSERVRWALDHKRVPRARLLPFRAEIGDRPGYVWVEDTFRRHRRS